MTQYRLSYPKGRWSGFKGLPRPALSLSSFTRMQGLCGNAFIIGPSTSFPFIVV